MHTFLHKKVWKDVRLFVSMKGNLIYKQTKYLSREEGNWENGVEMRDDLCVYKGTSESRSF